MLQQLPTKIQIGNISGATRDLIASGAFVLDKEDNAFSISIEDLRFEFQLLFDPEVSGQSTKYKVAGENALGIDIINPIHFAALSIRNKVGRLNGRWLHLGMFITNINQQEHQSRLINFSFSLGAEYGE